MKLLLIFFLDVQALKMWSLLAKSLKSVSSCYAVAAEEGRVFELSAKLHFFLSFGWEPGGLMYSGRKNIL